MKSAHRVKFPEAIPGQFILTSSSDGTTPESHPLRTSWTGHELGGLELRTAPDLPVVRCKAASGATIGYFLGDPVDFHAGRIIRDELLLEDPPADGAELGAWIEEQVYRYGGRWAFILSTAKARRLYVDAAASLAVVYDPEARIAGSTAGAVYGPDEFLSRFDADLFERMDILGGGWFPGELTPHRGLRRLLCNFYLDLNDWSAHRHWHAEIEESAEGIAAAHRLGEALRRGVLTYLESASCCMALTGGHETRLLLAAAHDRARSVLFYCLCDADSSRDARISEKLAQDFGLELRLLPFPPVSDSEANEWMARTGYCAGEHRYRYKGIEQLGGYDFRMGGAAGEVGRGFFWRPRDGEAPLDAANIYARLALPAHPAAEQAVAAWFDTLPTEDPLLQLDLAYLELRLSCWFAVQTYGSTGPKPAYPMISREVFTRMLELPPEWRRENRWILSVIRAFWPELLSVPINNLGPIREAFRSLQRVIRKPSLVTRRLKRRFG